MQTIIDTSGPRRREAARLLWHATPDQGTAQMLQLEVVPELRRAGRGTRLVREMLNQVARLNARRRNRPIRVVWTLVAQKGQLPARAFLTRMGFHHVATSKHLYLQDDAMIYARSMD